MFNRSIGDVFRHVGIYLYGRRMYETMVFWETAHTDPGVPPHILQYARDWQAAEKVVYSTTLESVSSEKTSIGLVDEYHLFVTPSVVGGGTRFSLDGVRLALELVEERAFDSGLIYARHRTR